MSEQVPHPNDTVNAVVEPAELGFAGCIDELDRIVRGLETDAIDVDELTSTVGRAADLVEWCRERLGEAQTRLEDVLPRLDLLDQTDLDNDAD